MESKEDRILRQATRWKYRREFKINTIGDLLNGTIRSKLKPLKRSSPVIEAWKKVVPPELNEFCQVKSFQNGTLKVAVSNPAYRFQMDMLKSELIESINNELTQSKKIKDVKFV